ncbi:MAG TPA: hypothetical protein VMD76_14070 [Candidatus Sulfotelmatobacter sp.]|nr:hypothetical protein [Candidatus Sulfotelmatobacter sp.]
MAESSTTSQAVGADSRTSSMLARWLMPSIADVIFVALLSVLVFTQLSVRLLGDAGIGWHVRTGELILQTHAIPRVDPFSSTMAGKPWFAWEWLYDVKVAWLHSHAGWNGVVWFTAVIIASVFAGMFRGLVLRKTNLFFAILLFLLAACASTIHFLARPHVLSWLFTLIFFWILDSAERDCFGARPKFTSPQVMALPILMLFWANLHGGFLLGFVLIGIFWFSALWTWLTTRPDRIEESLRKIAAGKRCLSLTWIALLSALASLINPYGWKLDGHIASYLSNGFLMDHIDEFQSPNFHGIAQKFFLILLLVSAAVLIARGRQLRPSGILVVLFSIYAGLYASRNIPTSSILLGMVVGPLLPATGVGDEFSQRMSQVESSLRGHLWPILAVLLTFLIALNGGRIGQAQLMNAHFSPQRMPVQAVDFLEQNHLHGPILSPDYWGGYLIYRLYPKTQVVLDDRHDLYGSSFLASYLELLHVEHGGSEFLREHQPEVILWPQDSALANTLARGKGAWKVLYRDQLSIVLVHDTENP